VQVRSFAAVSPVYAIIVYFWDWCVWSLSVFLDAGEEALRNSGVSYTVVRPGGLTNKPAGEVQLCAGAFLFHRAVGNGVCWVFWLFCGVLSSQIAFRVASEEALRNPPMSLSSPL
jgi:hypothetical protein